MNSFADSSDISLVGNEICPYCQRVRLALMFCSLEYKYQEVDFVDKPPWLRSVSPLGKVPVLLLNGSSILESVDIIDYLNRVSGFLLFPDGPVVASKVSFVIKKSNDLHDVARKYFMTKDEGEFERLFLTLRKLFLNFVSDCFDLQKYLGKDFSIVGVYAVPIFFLLGAFDKRHGDHSFFDSNMSCENLCDFFGRTDMDFIFSDEIRKKLLEFLSSHDTIF